MDAQGRVVPRANDTMRFALDDEATAFVLGVGNGDPAAGAQRDKSTDMRSRSRDRRYLLILFVILCNRRYLCTYTFHSDKNVLKHPVHARV